MPPSPRVLRLVLPWLAPWPLAIAVACSSSGGSGGAPTVADACGPDVAAMQFAEGGDGSPDPFGAKAAGQARAGRLRDASQIAEPANGRARVRVGDFVLANDRIAVTISSEGRWDGYVPFGGKIVAIEPVGDDGRPKGRSMYGESLFMVGLEALDAAKVSVIADGTDGKEAIVRAAGTLSAVPFLARFQNLLQPTPYGFPAVFDYVLAPGADHVVVRTTIRNTSGDDVDLSSAHHLGMFHDYRAQTFTPKSGFDKPADHPPFVAYDADAAFLVRVPGAPLETGLTVSGFQLFSGPGALAPACKETTFDFAEVLTASPGVDAVLEAERRRAGEAAWREVRGKVVEDPGGAPVGGALVHATNAAGEYLTRAVAGPDGAFVLHVPPGAVSLTPTTQGSQVPAPTAIGDADANVTLTLPQRGTIAVTTKDATTGEVLPVRVQILPTSSFQPAPPSFGVTTDEPNGRLYQAFATTGGVEVAVPPGSYRVIVTRGYEYEVFDQTVDAKAGEATKVDATLARSVDSTGIMCADLHIHSNFSVDAHDLAVAKVKSAIADGLDIPVSSEHEWIIDFQPIVKDLGLEKWAFGMSSEELTTFEYGHFGVVPARPDASKPNMGAVDWYGKKAPQLFPEVKARPEQPVLIVNHPSGGDFQAYFSSALFDRATAKGTPELWSEEFDGIEVFNNSDFDANRDKSVADWFALLNAGKRFFAVGSSDSHHIKTSPVGYPRTCMPFGHDDPTKLTPEAVRDLLRAGSATISGGLLMTKVQGPDGVGPGGTSTAGSYALTIRAPSWIHAATLEVIVDGQTTKTVPLTETKAGGAGPGNQYDATVDVQPIASAPRHWVVFHAKAADGKDLAPLHPGFKAFAVSNPIFF